MVADAIGTSGNAADDDATGVGNAGAANHSTGAATDT
jgi:hypothetical protein